MGELQVWESKGLSCTSKSIEGTKYSDELAVVLLTPMKHQMNAQEFCQLSYFSSSCILHKLKRAAFVCMLALMLRDPQLIVKKGSWLQHNYTHRLE